MLKTFLARSLTHYLLSLQLDLLKKIFILWDRKYLEGFDGQRCSLRLYVVDYIRVFAPRQSFFEFSGYCLLLVQVVFSFFIAM